MAIFTSPKPHRQNFSWCIGDLVLICILNWYLIFPAIPAVRWGRGFSNCDNVINHQLILFMVLRFYYVKTSREVSRRAMGICVAS